MRERAARAMRPYGASHSEIATTQRPPHQHVGLPYPRALIFFTFLYRRRPRCSCATPREQETRHRRSCTLVTAREVAAHGETPTPFVPPGPWPRDRIRAMM